MVMPPDLSELVFLICPVCNSTAATIWPELDRSRCFTCASGTVTMVWGFRVLCGTHNLLVKEHW